MFNNYIPSTKDKRNYVDYLNFHSHVEAILITFSRILISNFIIKHSKSRCFQVNRKLVHKSLSRVRIKVAIEVATFKTNLFTQSYAMQCNNNNRNK